MANHAGDQIKKHPRDYRYPFLKQSNQKKLPSNALVIHAAMKMSPRTWWDIEDLAKETSFPLYTTTKNLSRLFWAGLVKRTRITVSRTSPSSMRGEKRALKYCLLDRFPPTPIRGTTKGDVRAYINKGIAKNGGSFSCMQKTIATDLGLSRAVVVHNLGELKKEFTWTRHRRYNTYTKVGQAPVNSIGEPLPDSTQGLVLAYIRREYKRNRSACPLTLAVIAKVLKMNRATIFSAIEQLREDRLIDMWPLPRTFTMADQPMGTGDEMPAESMRRKVRAYIQLMCGRNGGTCSATLKTMATALKGSQASVSRAITQLTKDGEINVSPIEYLYAPAPTGSGSARRQRARAAQSEVSESPAKIAPPLEGRKLLIAQLKTTTKRFRHKDFETFADATRDQWKKWRQEGAAYKDGSEVDLIIRDAIRRAILGIGWPPG